MEKPSSLLRSLPAITILNEIITIKTTPYAAAAPRLKSRNSDAIAIEIGRFAGTNTSTEATYSPNAITNASRVPATAPGHTSGNVTAQIFATLRAPQRARRFSQPAIPSSTAGSPVTEAIVRPPGRRLRPPTTLAGSIRSVAADRLLVVDSLGLWVATTLGGGEPIHSAWLPVERAIRARAAGVVLVSDEVGLSPVALTDLGRRFVDALGWTNQRAAAIADEVRLVVAGLPVRLKP